jgi:hypothetical protein
VVDDVFLNEEIVTIIYHILQPMTLSDELIILDTEALSQQCSLCRCIVSGDHTYVL